jgi:V8-like Glu-specific endopeptidase
LAACGAGTPEESGSGPAVDVLAEQLALTADIVPARVKIRFRRFLQPPKGEETPVTYPPYDHRGTEEDARALAIEAQLPGPEPGWPERPPPGKRRVIFTDLEALEEHEMEVDVEQVTALYEVAKDRGINDASSFDIALGPAAYGSDLPDFDQVRAQGWSGGTDNRVAKPVSHTYPVNHNVLMRMGRLNNGCSATLVGRRLVLTAAHCVVQPDLSQVNQVYRARRSGETAPYGAVTTSAYWWDAQYSANGCRGNYGAADKAKCAPWDWALLLLPNNAWQGSPNGTPGWMGYWVPGTIITTSSVNRSEGYPACNLAESPSNCQPHVAYGQNSGCLASRWDVPQLYHFACDTGRGHSGAANYSFYPGQNGPYVLGVVVTQDCATCESAAGDVKAYPNGVRTMTSWLAGFITEKRAQYP